MSAPWAPMVAPPLPAADLLRDTWRTRAFGDFWSYMLLAEGAVDLACEPSLELHDMAACSVVVTEAGGMFTDADGNPGPNGVGAYASNGRLHEELLARLNPADTEDGDDEPEDAPELG